MRYNNFLGLIIRSHAVLREFFDEGCGNWHVEIQGIQINHENPSYYINFPFNISNMISVSRNDNRNNYIFY